ncbi:MAG TPA: PAS domain S-box protein [Thermoanaerobaculia bacterium]|jgi:PAS domain S-box-containing protein|nr:PAS domain S-box protein [Thermoanaerobaculia bacterium]
MTRSIKHLGMSASADKPADALKASEARYRRLFETAQDAILILNGDSGKIVDANPFVIDLLGYSLEELMGKQLWQIGLFPDIEASKAAFDRLHTSGYIRYEDLPLETKDGRRAEVEFVSNAYRVNGRNVIQCNIRDITERVEATRAMRASEVRYRRLFETAQDAILILDGDSGKVIDANPFVMALLGYSHEELVGKELWEIGLFRDINESKAAFDRLQRDGFIRYEDLPLETKGGKRAEVEFVSNAYKVEGRNIIQCNIRDITDRKSAEKAAQEGAERFRFLAESMPQMVFTARPDGAVDYFNQQWSAFTGLTLDDIKDWRWTRFIHPDDLKATVRQWQHSLDTGDAFEMQHRFRRANGVYRWHLSRACPMHDAAGNITMWISSNTDIDDQKRTEDVLSQLYKEAESLNRSKDEFLATLSHELRTPMTSILGWTALLAMGTLDEKSRGEGIATIHRSAKLQAQLIDDVLDVSRMVTGKLRLTIEPVDMESVLREALASFVPAAEAKELRLRMDFQPGLLFLGGDPARLQQVFWNLLSNAVKFTPVGGQIEVRLFSRDSNVVVEVQDSGLGIRPEFLPYAFDRFAQQEGGTKRHHGGMGIGLSIAKQLVELHGGTISVASEGEGLGSTFTVTIPVQATMPERRPVPIDSRRRAERSSSRAGVPSVAGLRVLIIDDEQDSRRTIAAILEQYGAVVTTASSADEGLALSTRESFDVLLCDIAMPEQDGYSLIRRIRLPDDERSHIPAVALTAYGRPTEREIALSEGFDEYLKKPVEPEDLVSLVANMAERNVSRVSM